MNPDHELRHWLVIPMDGDEWITRDAKEAEFFRTNPNCEVQGPFVLAQTLAEVYKEEEDV